MTKTVTSKVSCLQFLYLFGHQIVDAFNMKPFIFQFLETAQEQGHDFSLIAYDEMLNLSIDTVTGKPAISALELATETFTKTQNESSDSDNQYMSMLMATQTVTEVHMEATDSDLNRPGLAALMGTTTETRTYTEQSDSDY